MFFLLKVLPNIIFLLTEQDSNLFVKYVKNNKQRFLWIPIRHAWWCRQLDNSTALHFHKFCLVPKLRVNNEYCLPGNSSRYHLVTVRNNVALQVVALICWWRTLNKTQLLNNHSMLSAVKVTRFASFRWLPFWGTLSSWKKDAHCAWCANLYCH